MKIKTLAVSTLAVMILCAPLALAEKGGKKNRGYAEGYWYEQPIYGERYGLPPGLAKRGQLPPGLQKHLWKHGSLPPGLQKKIGPRPVFYAPCPELYVAPGYYHQPMRLGVTILVHF